MYVCAYRAYMMAGSGFRPPPSPPQWVGSQSSQGYRSPSPNGLGPKIAPPHTITLETTIIFWLAKPSTRFPSPALDCRPSTLLPRPVNLSMGRPPNPS